MRIYHNIFEAFRETERELWEMGKTVHPQTMQDKNVANDPNYATKELSPYTFQISNPYMPELFTSSVQYLFTNPNADNPDVTETNRVIAYIRQEFKDRINPLVLNPGTAWMERQNVWNEFIHDGKFAYTYNERFNAFGGQLQLILNELRVHPETRQAYLEIHSNSMDIKNMGGKSRIPCSLGYQFFYRQDALDIHYHMRSCDFLTHFPVDVILAIKLQKYVADQLDCHVGRFTYFTGSLHAYHKDMKTRGIF